MNYAHLHENAAATHRPIDRSSQFVYLHTPYARSNNWVSICDSVDNGYHEIIRTIKLAFNLEFQKNIDFFSKFIRLGFQMARFSNGPFSKVKKPLTVRNEIRKKSNDNQNLKKKNVQLKKHIPRALFQLDMYTYIRNFGAPKVISTILQPVFFS